MNFLCVNYQNYQSLLNEYNQIIRIYTDQQILLKVTSEKMYVLEKQRLVFNLFD